MGPVELFSQIRWRPQIGDPSFMGWITVAAYGATAALCLRAAIRQTVAADTREARRLRRMWLGVAGLMLFLCVNKQFDLQSLVTDVGRAMAAREGWYDQRRTVQRWFVFAAAAAGALTIAWMAWRIRFILRERIVLLLGLCSLLTFIVIRAASFHHVDVFLRSRMFGLRVNWILELGSIVLIAFGAIQSICRPRAG